MCTTSTSAAVIVRSAGASRINELRRCYDCGYPMAKKARYCPRCGARQRPERVRPTPRFHHD